MNNIIKLIEEYTTTDSISKSKEIENEVCKIAESFLKEKIRLSKKYNYYSPCAGIPDWYIDDYLEAELKCLQINNYQIVLGIKNERRYFDERIYVVVEDIKNFDSKKLEDDLKSRKIEELRKEIEKHSRLMKVALKEIDALQPFPGGNKKI